MKSFAAFVVLASVAVALVNGIPLETEQAVPSTKLEPIAVQPVEKDIVPRDKRGLFYGAAYTAPFAYSAYTAPIAYSAYSAYPYAYTSAYSSYPYYAAAYTSPYYY